MPPTVVGVGAADATSPWQPALPVEGVAENDIVLIVVEQVGGEPSPTASGYAHVTGSPVVQATNTQLSVLWKRAGAGETAAAVTGPVNHAMTRTIAIRGCPTTGNPWSAVAVAVEATLDTSAAWPGVTSTGADDCLVLELIATGRDFNSTTNLGALTNAAYSAITERMNNWTATGTGGGIGLVTAVQATTGPTGSSTATMGSTDPKAMMTLVLKPDSGAEAVRPHGLPHGLRRPAAVQTAATW